MKSKVSCKFHNRIFIREVFSYSEIKSAAASIAEEIMSLKETEEDLKNITPKQWPYPKVYVEGYFFCKIAFDGSQIPRIENTKKKTSTKKRKKKKCKTSRTVTVKKETKKSEKKSEDQIKKIPVRQIKKTNPTA